MLNMKPKVEAETTNASDASSDSKRSNPLPVWETPRLEDVSEQVMAQPYIRFT